MQAPLRRAVEVCLRSLMLACLLLAVSCSGPPTGDTPATAGQNGSIAGTVREAGTDLPIAGVSVFLVRTSDQLQVRTTTDADGRFSLQGLNAGRHLVAVVREGYVIPGRQEISGLPFRIADGQQIRDAVFRMIPAGTITGRIFHEDGTPANRVEVQLLQNLYVMGRPQWSAVNRGGTSRNTIVQTNDRGEFRALGVDPGNYILRFVPREITVQSRIPGGVSPAPMVYPTGRDVAKAKILEVQSGRETLLDDVKLRKERRAWIRVLVVNESGESLEGFGDWTVKPVNWIGAEYPLMQDRITNNYHEIQPDAPGVYDITATWSTATGRLTGTARVNYRSSDIEVKMPIRKGEARVTGHVLLEDAAGGLRAIQGAEVAIGPRVSYFARSGPDGAILLPEVYAGRYQLGYVRGLPADAFVWSVRQGSRDLFKEEMVVGGDEASLEIVVRTGAGVVSGKVTDAAGQPVHNGLVALVPEPPLRERKDYYGAFKEIHTDQNGEFEIGGVTPGAYRAYAWTDAPASAFRNAEFMKAFAGRGSVLTVELNGKASVELKALMR